MSREELDQLFASIPDPEYKSVYPGSGCPYCNSHESTIIKSSIGACKMQCCKCKQIYGVIV